MKETGEIASFENLDKKDKEIENLRRDLLRVKAYVSALAERQFTGSGVVADLEEHGLLSSSVSSQFRRGYSGGNHELMSHHVTEEQINILQKRIDEIVPVMYHWESECEVCIYCVCVYICVCARVCVRACCAYLLLLM